MELSTYTVKPGDSLSGIASQHASTVTELQRLNRFIQDPDKLQPGWNLSVPARPTPTIAPTPAIAEEKPARGTDVLQLDPLVSPQPSTSACFDKQQHACSPRFANIIYATDEQAFWLLPQSAADAIAEAGQLLEQQITPNKSMTERKRGLDASGLLDYFLEPNLSNFLEGEEKARMQYFERELPHIADPALTLRLQDQANGTQAPLQEPTDDRDEAIRRDSDFQQRMARLKEMQKLHHEWQGLRTIAIEKARQQNYTYENGRLFTAMALEARSRVQHYLHTRNKLLEQGELPTYDLNELPTLLEKQNQLYLKTTDFQNNAGSDLNYAETFKQLVALEDYKNYIDAIIKVADYGLAVPEFALIDAPQGQLPSGISQFNSYLNYLKQQNSIEQRLQDKYLKWIEASGQNAQAPGGLVAAERAQWDALQANIQALYDSAQQAVAKRLPRRHLLWNPEQFEPQPIDRLVKSNFPLREVSWPDTPGKPVRHISLSALRGLLSPTATFKKSYSDTLGAKVDEAYARHDFNEWLEGVGAIKVDDQGEWFDQHGWFDVERFYQHLHGKLGYQIDSLQAVSARQEWGERLRQMLFQDDARRSLRLFDKSPQAQLVRCLNPAPNSIQAGIEVEGPSFSPLEGASSSVTASLDIDLARGEVELCKVELPKPEQAREITATYINYRNQCSALNLGRFSAQLSARAWGFAGASLQLAANLELSPSNLRYGANLSPIEPATRTPATLSRAGSTSSDPVVHGRTAKVQIEDGTSASFNLFAGVQAGIEVTGLLRWAPPKDLVRLRTAPSVRPNSHAALPSEWLSLAQLTLAGSAAAGLGAEGEISLSLHQGRLILRLKAALIAGPGASGSFAFAVGYEAIGELLDLLRRELRENQYHPLQWIDGSAFDLISKLNLFGAIGMDVGMIYMLSLTTADAVANLYEALTAGGNGGPIAHSIISYENQAELERWFIDALPEALGPMLMTLISPAKSFEVASNDIVDGRTRESVKTYTETQCWLLQQRAIERILGWIVRNAQSNGTVHNAQRQFDETCTRMNRFGSKLPKPGKTYCENRTRMNHFMDAQVMNIGQDAAENERMRADYQRHAKILGQLRDGFCQETNHYGITYIPGGHSTYNGPGE